MSYIFDKLKENGDQLCYVSPVFIWRQIMMTGEFCNNIIPLTYGDKLIDSINDGYGIIAKKPKMRDTFCWSIEIDDKKKIYGGSRCIIFDRKDQIFPEYCICNIVQ